MSSQKPSYDEDLRRKLLLLMGGMHYQEIPRVLSAAQIKRFKETEKDRTSSRVSFPGEHHLYSSELHQTYNYLGPGTQYKKRQVLGIEPINDLDRIAMYHDAGYSSYTGGSYRTRLLTRGFHDFGAGAAMLTAAMNPWSDAPFAMSTVAGAALIAQGIIRFHPLTALPMAIIDFTLYDTPEIDPAIGDARKLLYA